MSKNVAGCVSKMVSFTLVDVHVVPSVQLTPMLLLGTPSCFTGSESSAGAAGLSEAKSYAMQNAILTLRGRFAWAHDFNTDRNIAATFQTLPGASFVVNGAAQAHDAALTTASAEMQWINGWSATATFEGEFSNVTRSYGGKGVVRYQW